MELKWTRAIAGGVVGTLIMTAIGVWIAPLMGLAPMNPADMLAGAMGGNALLGWAAHLMIGIALALIYALVASRLPGSAPVRGALFAVAPWLVAMVAMLPMMGMPAFGGGAGPAMGSLLGHLVYGAIVGAIYGDPRTSPAAGPVRV